MDAETVLQFAPRCSADLAQSLVAEMPKWGIDTKPRQQMFLAQCCHESAGLTRFVENLNYSAEGLMRTWPSRFPSFSVATEYARQPEKIANHVYANRLGNGNEASGDGWKYRGRGIIQLTGRTNYRRAGDGLEYPLDQSPQNILVPGTNAAAACWFWSSHGLNELADRGEYRNITLVINGGLIGQADRDKWLASIRATINT